VIVAPLRGFVLLAGVLLSSLLCAGCSLLPGWAGGEDGLVHIDLDNEYRVRETMGIGETLLLDMRSPARSGYEMAGASFDPAVVRLDAVHPDPDDPERVHYVFVTLTPGDTLIEVTMLPVGGGEKVTYKIVDLTVDQ
jgi:hypothetical protein